MKKNFWGILFTITFLCVGFLLNVAATPGNTNVDNILSLSSESRTISRNNNGVFILRDSSVDNSTDDTSYFSGRVYSNTDLLPTANTKFRFTAVKEHNGLWYTASEYYSQVLNLENVSGVMDWFEITESVGGVGDYKDVVTWELRKKSLPGRYAIRARVVEDKSAIVDEKWVENYEEYTNYFINGDFDPFDYYYVILYGEEIQNINCIDSIGSRVYNVGQRGLNTVETVRVFANPGAMRLDDLFESVVQRPENGFVGGELSVLLDINSWVLDIVLEKDGKVITQGSDTILVSLIEGGLEMTIPQSLPKGQYVVKFFHESSPNIIGTYIIDNGLTIYNSSNGGRVAGVLFLVIGMLVLLSGTFLYAAPKIVYAIQQSRYKALEDKVYRKDKASIKAREKEAAAAPPVAPKLTGKSFLSSLAEKREKRENARELGMSLEEYLEIEKKREINEKAKEHSLSDIRGFSGPEMVKEDTTDMPKHGNGTPVFDLLDSVRDQAAFAGEEFVQNIIKPNVVHEEAKEEAATTQLPHQTGGLLSRIRSLTENKE